MLTSNGNGDNDNGDNDNDDGNEGNGGDEEELNSQLMALVKTVFECLSGPQQALRPGG